MAKEELVSEEKEPASEQKKSSGRQRRAGFRTQRRADFGINEESASEKR